MTTAPPEGATAGAANGRRRKRLLFGLTTLFLAAGVGYGLYWATTARYAVFTDDAYVAGNVLQVTPQIAGTVLAIHADDTDLVRVGQTLVRLDAADVTLALDEAEAQLARTVRDVRTLFATGASLAATVRLRETTLSRLNDDLARRSKLASSGAVSVEEVTHARNAVMGAEAELAEARMQYEANRALTDRTTLAGHPNVLRVAAQVRSTALAVSRTVIPAPATGYIAKRAVQVGQRVTPGVPMMALVPLDQVWVEANFKEAQLRRMRIGQPVTLTADLYGDDVVFHGHVAGLGAGTGSAFALLPAQNATGNWIKIVQRVPVRIAVDPREILEHPLRVGLSMAAEVDVKETSGPQLASGRQRETVAETAVYADQGSAAEEIIRRIIGENSESAGERGPSHASALDKD
jgi:membrane fusion protein (multidrug efflux system)